MKNVLKLILTCMAAVTIGCGSDDTFVANNIQNIARLTFTNLASTVTQGSNLPPFQVRLEDPNGNLYTAANGQVTLTLGNNPTGASLLNNGQPVSSIVVQGTNGQATFNNVGISLPGSGYTLVATVTDPFYNQTITATSSAIAVTPVVTRAVFFTSEVVVNRIDLDNQDENRAALDAAFGVGNYTQAFFGEDNPARFLQPGTFMMVDSPETEAVEKFLESRAQLEAFVNAGGRLLVNYQNLFNEGDVPLLFDVVADTSDSQAPDGIVNANHPIGVACNGHREYTTFGSIFAFCGLNSPTATTVITGSPTNLPALVELNPGLGRVLIGALSTPNTHRPQPQGDILRENIIRYTAGLTLRVAPTEVEIVNPN